MSCPMSVQTLLEGWCDTVPDIVVTGIGLDSRRIKPGQAFLAVAGATTHGLAHAAQAEASGAAVVIHDGLAETPPLGIPDVVVPGLGGLLSGIGQRGLELIKVLVQTRAGASLSREQVFGLIERARDLVAAGRPPCAYCGRPLEPRNRDWCPCLN